MSLKQAERVTASSISSISLSGKINLIREKAHAEFFLNTLFLSGDLRSVGYKLCVLFNIILIAALVICKPSQFEGVMPFYFRTSFSRYLVENLSEFLT